MTKFMLIILMCSTTPDMHGDRMCFGVTDGRTYENKKECEGVMLSIGNVISLKGGYNIRNMRCFDPRNSVADWDMYEKDASNE